MTVRKLLVRTAIAAALTWAGAAQAAVTLYGLSRPQSGRNLVSFYSETPGTFTSSVAITSADGTVDFFGLDLNTSNNKLYSLGSLGSGRYALYTIALDGVATRIGTDLTVNLGTENISFDYDSSANVFRAIGNNDKVYAITPDNGTPKAGKASGGQKIDYGPNSEFGAANPVVVAAGYRGSLYVLDKNGPGSGNSPLSTLTGSELNSVAKVKIVLDTNASFDIAGNDEAYFDSGVVLDHLYKLNLTDGSIIDKGQLKQQLTGLTAGPAVPEPTTWAMMIAGFGLTGAVLRRRRATRPVPA